LKRGEFLDCPVDYRAADNRGLSMHIVSDYANSRAFCVADRRCRCSTVTLFARARLHRKFRRAASLAQNVPVLAVDLWRV